MGVRGFEVVLGMDEPQGIFGIFSVLMRLRTDVALIYGADALSLIYIFLLVASESPACSFQSQG